MKLNEMISGQDYLNSMDPNGPNGPNGPNSPNGPNGPNSPNGPNGPNGRMGSYASSGPYYVLPRDHPPLPSISSSHVIQLFSGETPGRPDKIPAKVRITAGIERS